ncbi:MAG TPA: SulP family inorganic anion transporter [Bryobacteraceae bacterium]|nr:SulP family inorganic anion transporter [Bryobacteraceae bacterium]
MGPHAKSGGDQGSRLPVLQGLLPFEGVRIGPEIIAGITLGALGIPEVMGYTKIIGTPVITGLYTMFLPVLAFALFGSSRHLVVAADSATAAMVAAGLASLSLIANTPRYVALTSLIALVTAGILLLARLFRLGFLADFLSRTVLVGFLSGVGVQVALGELHEMLGIEKGGHGFLHQLLFTLQRLPETHLPTLFIALAVLAIIVGSEILAPRFPGALLAVIGMIVASSVFQWKDRGIGVVGAVPGGLPHLGLPGVTLADITLVLPIAFSCFIVILAQSAATSRAYALVYRDNFSQNVDLVGLSVANAIAACSGTFVVNGSPTKTAMVDTAGGRTQWSQMTTAALVLMVLLFLTGPLSYLPNAVLAAIVFLVGVKLIDFRGLAEIRRSAPREFLLAIVTALTVVIFGVEQGILLAAVVSLLQHVRHSYRPQTGVMVQDAGGTWRLEELLAGRMTEPGLFMFWFGSDLFYANVAFFAEQARRLVRDSPSPVRWLVIDATAITGLDYSAGRALAELHQDLDKIGVVLALVQVPVEHHANLEQMGLVDLIGSGRIFDSRHACVAAYKTEFTPRGAAPAGGPG